MLQRIVRYCFAHGQHKPTGPIFAPSVQDKMIYINVYNDGEFERIPAYIGESLLSALRRFRVTNIPGDCEGGEKLDSILEDPVQTNTFGPSCGSCHILISSPWIEKIRDPFYLEEFVINRQDYAVAKHSRLACAIKLEKWMDEMEVSIPINENSENM
ncbi:unnamed protein product [Paramecium octaurelia]|uniref:2Fe-2S ferredoxin-type domain-containing protein n=1 Tax=Paramecium octaurelia TaxID=43137 RepID=A0A8S1SUB3_PAROT|nr:unnamed protein product [Paramecium octaurelia]